MWVMDARRSLIAARVSQEGVIDPDAVVHTVVELGAVPTATDSSTNSTATREPLA